MVGPLLLVASVPAWVVAPWLAAAALQVAVAYTDASEQRSFVRPHVQDRTEQFVVQRPVGLAASFQHLRAPCTHCEPSCDES